MKEITFGSIYTENEKLRYYLPRYYEVLNDQKQHYWFPIRVVKNGEDDIYMLDTYQFDMPYDCRENYAKMIDYLKSLGEPKDYTWVKNKAFDYYYSAVIKLTPQNIEAFELVANLEEYEIANEDVARYYNQKDVIHRVKFWNYHRGGRGVIIKRKNAEMCYDLKIDNLYCDVLKDIQKPNLYDYTVRQLLDCEQEAINNNATYDKTKIEYIKKIQKYIHEIRNNYEIYDKKLKKELGIK
jgi:hypothetical protein